MACPVTVAVSVNWAPWATFAEPVVRDIDVANGPTGGGGGGGVVLPPPQPMIRLMMQARPKANDARKFFFLTAQQTQRKTAKPLRMLRGQVFDLKGKKRTPLRLRTTEGFVAAAPVGGDNVSITGEAAPLTRFTADG